MLASLAATSTGRCLAKVLASRPSFHLLSRQKGRSDDVFRGIPPNTFVSSPSLATYSLRPIDWLTTGFLWESGAGLKYVGTYHGATCGKYPLFDGVFKDEDKVYKYSLYM